MFLVSSEFSYAGHMIAEASSDNAGSAALYSGRKQKSMGIIFIKEDMRIRVGDYQRATPH